MVFHQGTAVPQVASHTTAAIRGQNVVLRTAGPDDMEARFILGNDPEIFQMFGVSRNDVKPMSRERAGGWVQSIIENQYAWIVEIDGALVGEIRLNNVDRTDRRASMAIGIYDAKVLSKGFGSEAIRLLLHYAFTELNLHRIGIRVLAFNHRAIRAYEKCGFIFEGREREAAFVNGEWHDDLMMGIIGREFLSQN
ncbi:GCN5 family acetyltransferase [Pararhizobium antarcticum]|uniref:GCN5 family acetyltransferase n=2 Tax=Pararhizobium antarcticum TaxID=1798805 RepID=A0A657LQF1_9HYPH|nr:GNAT family protein [Pararhizobium antarcticum]OJF93647.1 GCN5 family acetyltransferase [Rhizobium sp. 58]OJF95133.1 GCN5 family acetyltransferase [Pararhizobium antarcticum]